MLYTPDVSGISSTVRWARQPSWDREMMLKGIGGQSARRTPLVVLPPALLLLAAAAAMLWVASAARAAVRDGAGAVSVPEARADGRQFDQFQALRADLNRLDSLDNDRESLGYAVRRLGFAKGLLKESSAMSDRRGRLSYLDAARRALDEAQLWGREVERLAPKVGDELIKAGQLVGDLGEDPHPARIEVAIAALDRAHRSILAEERRVGIELENVNDHASAIFEQVLRKFRGLPGASDTPMTPSAPARFGPLAPDAF